MRKNITRTITTTTIESVTLKIEEGEVVKTENEPLVLNGIVAEEKAMKEARKEYGQFAQVTKVEQNETLYEISVEDFMKYATVVEPKKEEE